MSRFILLSIIILLCGCSPERRLSRLLERFPPDTTTVIQLRDTTIYKDTIIYRHLPGDTVWSDIYIPLDVDVPDTSLKTVSTMAKASAGISGNVLWLELIQYDTVFEFLLDSAIQENRDTVFITNNIPYPALIKPNPFWKHGFWVLAGLILVSLFLFFVFRK